MSKSHKDVEFEVGAGQKVFKTFDEAIAYAVTRALSDGRAHAIDVLIYSTSGARWWGGDIGVESYNEDPHATVFERIEILAESVGRIA